MITARFQCSDCRFEGLINLPERKRDQEMLAWLQACAMVVVFLHEMEHLGRRCGTGAVGFVLPCPCDGDDVGCSSQVAPADLPQFDAPGWKAPR